MARQTLDEILGGVKRFGRLVVLAEAEPKVRPGKGVIRRIRCRCDCGDERSYVLANIKRGASKSCGCLTREINRSRFLTHGESRNKRTGGISAEYRVWLHINGRCHTPSDTGYHNYGGRGIAVCPEWRDSYERFLADMGRRPSDEHQIDRIDNDGNYEPGNCRWVTFDVQCRNKRTNRWVMLDGEKMILEDAARKLGLTSQAPSVMRRCQPL